MAENILSACRWLNPGFEPPAESVTGSPPKVSLVQERSGVDGSSLLVALLTYHLRAHAGNHVLLFATHRTTAHYVGACQKVSFHAEPAIRSGHLHIIDVLAELYGQCGRIDPGSQTGDVGTQFLTRLKKRISTIPSSGNALVIVDDLSFYAIVDPTASENGVIDFVEELLSSSLLGVRHIVLKVNVSECYERLCATLADLANVNILMEPLPSGSFRDVDGRLTVHHTDRADGSCFVLPELHAKVLYKVGDRQIRTYLPGEFGIKNL